MQPLSAIIKQTHPVIYSSYLHDREGHNNCLVVDPDVHYYRIQGEALHYNLEGVDMNDYTHHYRKDHRERVEDHHRNSAVEVEDVPDSSHSIEVGPHTHMTAEAACVADSRDRRSPHSHTDRDSVEVVPTRFAEVEEDPLKGRSQGLDAERKGSACLQDRHSLLYLSRHDFPCRSCHCVVYLGAALDAGLRRPRIA